MFIKILLFSILTSILNSVNTESIKNFILNNDLNNETNTECLACQETMYFINNEYVTKSELYKLLYNFINKYKKRHLSEEYVNDLIDVYIYLIDKEDADPLVVLYFVALCSVESNFDQFAKSNSSVGISQVVYSVHKKYITELGISKENFYNSYKYNILAGYKIFWCYSKSSNWDLYKAASKYNGNSTKGYANKVNTRFLSFFK